MVDCTYGKQAATLPLYIVDHNGPALLGRNWLQHLRLDWNVVFGMEHDALEPHASLDQILQENAELFDGTLGNNSPQLLHICH